MAYKVTWFYVLFLKFVYLNSVRNEVENYYEVNEVKLLLIIVIKGIKGVLMDK